MKSIKIKAKKENIFVLAECIKNKIYLDKKPVFMCIGSDKYIADSLGPMIGEILKRKYNIQAYIYGNLDYNINATNLVACYNYIKTIHPQSQIIAIDATLGDNIGEIIIGDGAYAGMGKNLPLQKYGDWSILGVVAQPCSDFRLNSVRLQTIVLLSEIISCALNIALDYKK